MNESSTRSEDRLPQASLGKRREAAYTYRPDFLEAIPFADDDHSPSESPWVTLQALRFTSLCPVTGQPDWAEITINYIPALSLVESKSLKEYLGSFRMHGDFHEDVCRIICDDLTQLLQPHYLEVVGCFDSRGSIAIWPYVQYASASNEEAQAIRRHRRMHYTPGAYTPDPQQVR